MKYPYKSYLKYLVSKQFSNTEIREECLRLSMLSPDPGYIEELKTELGTIPRSWEPSYNKKNEYFCRWLRKAGYNRNIENLLSLYSIFTEEEVKYCSNSVNCTEQYLFMREMLKNCEEKYYYKYIKEKTGIIDLKSIDGVIEKMPYKNKNDKEYHNQERHDYVIQGILANE